MTNLGGTQKASVSLPLPPFSLYKHMEIVTPNRTHTHKKNTSNYKTVPKHAVCHVSCGERLPLVPSRKDQKVQSNGTLSIYISLDS